MQDKSKRILISAIKTGMIYCIAFTVLYIVLYDEFNLFSLFLADIVIMIFVVSGELLIKSVYGILKKDKNNNS